MTMTDKPSRLPASRRNVGRRIVAAVAATALVAGVMTTAGALAPTNAVTTIVNPTHSRPRDVMIHNGKLYWPNISTNRIQTSNLDGSNVQLLSTDAPLSGPSGLATDGTYLYWTNGQAGGTTIGRSLLDGSGVNDSFITGADVPIGIAYHAGNLYWTNFAGSTIGRAAVSGSGPATGVSQSFMTVSNYPYGLEVNSSGIFWSDYLEGSGPSVGTVVKKATLAGTGQTDLVTTANGPTGVTADATYLYWANYANGTIGRSKLDGTSVTTAFVSGQVEVVGVAVDATHLYFTSAPDPANFSGPVPPNKILRAEFDLTPPVLTGPATFSVVATSNPMTVVYSPPVSATDPDDADDKIVKSCDVGTLTGITITLGSGPSTSQLVTCTASDEVGNTATRSFTVTVTRPAAPVLTLPSNILTVATSLAGATVNYPAVTATSGTVACAPASGTVFVIGTTTVSCTANDGVNPATTGSFTITVTNPGSPPIVVPANIVATATSPAGAVVTYPPATSTDGTPSCSPASGSTFAIGVNTVTCSVTNTFGTATGTFTVTVNRPAPPVVSVPANIVEGSSLDAGKVVTYPAASSSSGTVSCLPPSGSAFPIGVTTVTCTATDAYGQTGSRTFTITVNKEIPLVPVVPVNPTGAGGPIPGSGTNPGGVPVTTTAPATTAPTATVAATAPATAPTVPPTTVAPTTTTTKAPAAAPTAAPADTAAVATPVLGDPTFTG